MEKHKDALARATRQRELVEDCREVINLALGGWKGQGRIAPYVEVSCAMVAGHTLHMILTDGSRGVADLTSQPYVCKHIPK